MLNAQPISGLVGLVLVIALLGGMAFLGFASTDIANFQTRLAEARVIEQKANLEAKRGEIDLQAYQKKVERETQAEEERAAQEKAYQQRKQAWELEMQEAFIQVIVKATPVLYWAATITGSLVVLMIFGTLTLIAVRWILVGFPPDGPNDNPPD